MVELPLEGGCHCGAVRYRIAKAPLMVYNCHCKNCQKIGGGAFATSVTIFEDAFSLEGVPPGIVEWVSDAGTQRFGWYCESCGSRIAHGQTPSIGVLSLRGGTLDDTSWVVPGGDIWTSSAQPWLEFPEGRITTERQPTDYSPFIEAFAALDLFAD